MATTSKRVRDFKAEYRARLTKGFAKGLSRSQARGHSRAGERPSAGPMPVNRDDPFERALRMMKAGASQKAAANTAGVSVERLRRFQKENTQAIRQGGRWIISDQRPVSMLMATRGKTRVVSVPYDAASDVGRHWVAVNKFLETNDTSYLLDFIGKGLRDTEGRFHPFETRPNVLWKLDSIGELNFIDIYRDVT